MWHLLSRCGNVHWLENWSAAGGCLLDNVKLVDRDMLILDFQIGADFISRTNLLEHRIVSNRIRHGHRFHEAGNGIVIDDQLVPELVDGHDPAVQRVVMGLRLFAAANQGKSERAGHEGKSKVTKPA